MVPLLVARGIEKSFGNNKPVLRGCDLVVEPGERVGLVGVNGSGKSTLVRILGGMDEPDHGTVDLKGSLGVLEQDPALPWETVGEAADEGIRWHAELLAQYEEAAHTDMRLAAQLQQRLDAAGWEIGHRVDAMLTRLGAPPRDAAIARLSGGERRRLALARTLLGDPDLLLLDEPTNHLDADTVEWLQGFLGGHRGAVVLVTHDRYLLEAVATRIVEVEDGVCVSYDGSYSDYLISRAERRMTQERQEDQRLSMITREAAWASRSPAAQTSKQKARLDRLAAMQALRPLRKTEGFEIDLRSGLKHGSTVLEIHRAKKAYGGRTLMRDVELSLTAGERIGILGPNGAGKSTLLRMITGQEKPDAGEVVRGARVRIAVLDQERTGLDLNDTVFEAAGGGNDQVRVGEHWIHVASFLSRFLFSKEFHGRRVSALSGGERARLLLARLLLQGANLLLLDEPTNDLDLSTLRVLEEALLAYDGVAVIVTHDRAFLDRVCTGVVAFEGDGKVVRYATRQQHLAALANATSPSAATTRAEKLGRNAPRRLSFREQKEMVDIPLRIEALETEMAALTVAMADPASWKAADAAEQARRLGAIPGEIEALWGRWGELDGLP